jgi:phosphatidylinositol-3,4,5-trisphosphate 3-phosphatase/dual-specificity protein phosphatase PTEN
MNSLRKLVAGPKVRTIENGFDLDLTYVTNRVIAMAFPGSGLEALYRNSINDVVNYLMQV